MPTATLAEVQVRGKSSYGGSEKTKPGEAVSLAGRGATFKSQASALYRKNAVFQRRNWCSNACLLSAPIFFCLLLLGIQVAINKLLLTGEDYAVSQLDWDGGAGDMAFEKAEVEGKGRARGGQRGAAGRLVQCSGAPGSGSRMAQRSDGSLVESRCRWCF
jgi:hypothetical protein